MSEITLDRRQARTRTAIVEAFLSLLFERHYAAVSVADIIALANIGRSTFYDHFQTKADLLRHTLSDPLSQLASTIDPQSTPEQLEDLLEHFREHHRLSRALFAEPTRTLLQRVLTEQVEKRLPDTDIPRTLVAAQIAALLWAALEPWLMSQVALSTAAMARHLHHTGRAVADAARAMNTETSG